jgi:hypothetical protein
MTDTVESLNTAPKYNKIQNLFKRESEKPYNIKPLTFGNEAIGFLLNANWIVQEKIDGTNVRIIWDGNRITFGGKNTLDPNNLPGRLRIHLEENYGTSEFENVIEQVFGDTPVTIYGEGYGHKIQQGAGYFPDSEDGENQFIGFDVMINGQYTSVSNAQDIFAKLDIPFVECAPGTYTIPELVLSSIVRIRETEEGEPVFVHDGTNHEIEGYVLRTDYPLYDHRGNRVITKVILDDLKWISQNVDDEIITEWFSVS